MTNQDIINKLLDHLHHYLMSHQEMLISESFKLSMKVLSQHHMRLRGLIGILHKMQNSLVRPRKKNFILPTPVGFKDHENVFLGQCAIISALLGKGFNSHLLEDNSDFPRKDISYFIRDSNNILKIKKVGVWILNKLRHFLESKNIQQDSNGYNCDINKKLQEYLNCQIHIFCDESSDLKVASYPAKYNPTMEQINLLQTQADVETVHYEAITNISQFFNSVRRRYCFDCGIITKSLARNWRHSCQNRKCCLSCRRICFSDDLWCLPRDKKNFCDQRDKKKYGSCKLCNLNFLSSDCEANHRRVECRRGLKCLKCTRYIPVNGKRANQEEILAKHVCGERTCSDCFEIYENSNHICFMKKQTPQREWNKVSFFSFSFLKNEFDQNVPAQACLIFEQEKAGIFFVKMFHGTKDTIDKEGFEYNYWPTNVDRKLTANGIRGNFGKTKTVPSYLSASLPQENIAVKVLKFIFDKKEFQNTTFVMPTYSDLLEIQSALIRLKIYPNVLRKDSKILSVAPNDINIRFVCFLNFQGMAFKNEDRFFPLNMKLTDLHKEDIKLDYADFQDFDDSSTTKEQKRSYIGSLKNNYSFKIQGLDFLFENSIALAKSCLMYIKDSFDLQKELIDHLAIADPTGGTNAMPFLNPLSHPFVSNGSFIYSVFRLFVLNDFEIACIPKENVGLSISKVSKGEAQYVYWLNRNHYVRAFYNHISGQTKEFNILYPDAHDKESSSAYFYNGCYYHNHPRNECKQKGKNYKKRKIDNDKESFQSKRQRFEEAYPNVNVIVKWECQWHQDMKKQEVTEWFDNHPWAKDPPLNRLIPREAVRGGSSETYNFLWSKKRNLGETLVYADVISQYPAIALSHEFPIGNFEVIIGPKLKDILVSSNELMYAGNKLYGLVMLSIEAPQGLEFPFLSHRIKDSVSVAALCTSCAKDQTLTTCNHTGMQKFITGTYTSIEINYALSLGYRIQNIYEAWHWSQKGPIYKKFMQLLLRKKVMYSGFPKDNMTESEKQSYCSRVNITLSLCGKLALQTKDIKYDKRLKDYFKHLTVASVGKVGQGNIFPSDVFASNNDTVNKYFYNEDGTVSDSISDIELINGDTLYLRVKPSKESAVTNRTGNCVIQAMITAQARIGMHMTLMSVVQAGCKVFSLEADAIVFSHKNTIFCPLKFGDQVGDFKLEYSDIQSYSTLGPKTSNVTFFDGAIKQNIVKIKGLNLTGQIASGCVDSQIYEQQVIDLLHGIEKKVMVWQKRNCTSFSKCIQSSFIQEYSFSNWIMKNRRLFWDTSGLRTLPYGYFC